MYFVRVLLSGLTLALALHGLAGASDVDDDLLGPAVQELRAKKQRIGFFPVSSLPKLQECNLWFSDYAGQRFLVLPRPQAPFGAVVAQDRLVGSVDAPNKIYSDAVTWTIDYAHPKDTYYHGILQVRDEKKKEVPGKPPSAEGSVRCALDGWDMLRIGLNARELRDEPLSVHLDKRVRSLFSSQVEQHLRSYADGYLKQVGVGLREDPRLAELLKQSLLEDRAFIKTLAAELAKEMKK